MTLALLLTVAAGCWNGQSGVMYGYEAEHRSWWAKLDKKTQRQHLERAGLWPDDPDAFVTSQIQRLDDGTYVAVHEHCAKKNRCVLRVTHLDDKGKPTKKHVDLDPGPDAEVMGTALDDFDADGTVELVVRQYGRAKRTKRKKTTQSFLHVIEVPSLERSLRAELGWVTSDEDDDVCETAVSRHDDRCSGHPSVEAFQECGKRVKTWRWDFDTKSGRFVEDRRKWAVIAGAVKQEGEGVSPLADDKLQAVKKAGFSHATLEDSKTFPKMKCCFDIVVVGRFEQKSDATALLERLKAKKVDAYVRRAF